VTGVINVDLVARFTSIPVVVLTPNSKNTPGAFGYIETFDEVGCSRPMFTSRNAASKNSVDWIACAPSVQTAPITALREMANGEITSFVLR